MEDESVLKSITAFLPLRNELIRLFSTIAQYEASEENLTIIHRFFESDLLYLEPPEGVTEWQKWDFDNFTFIIHELFLYLISIFIFYRKYSFVDSFLATKYYVPYNSDYGKNTMVDYGIFRKYMNSLSRRNERLKLNKLSIRADLLRERCVGIGIDFRQLLQADFILFLRAGIAGREGPWSTWWPETLLYLDDFHSSFEIFARSVSLKYFNEIKCLLKIEKIWSPFLMTTVRMGRKSLAGAVGHSVP